MKTINRYAVTYMSGDTPRTEYTYTPNGLGKLIRRLEKQNFEVLVIHEGVLTVKNDDSEKQSTF